MSARAWPTLAFVRQLFLFYLVVWLGTGALTIIAVCFWYAPFITAVISYTLVITAGFLLLTNKLGLHQTITTFQILARMLLLMMRTNFKFHKHRVEVRGQDAHARWHGMAVD